jgi:hypothetical protein
LISDRSKKKKSILLSLSTTAQGRVTIMAEYVQENPHKPDKKREDLKGKILQLKDLVTDNEDTLPAGW